MPATRSNRWTQTADGSWTRTPGYTEETPRATQTALEAAEELGVDISTVTGTGKDGRVTKADVEEAASA